MEKDGFLNKNEIRASDGTAAVKKATDDMEQTARKNTSLLMNAQNRARELIENYINQLCEITGSKYTINWEYTDESRADTSDSETEIATEAESR